MRSNLIVRSLPVTLGFILLAAVITPAAAQPQQPAELEVYAAQAMQHALQADLAGDDRARQGSLRIARTAAPQWPPAHWHSGRVQYQDRWMWPAEVTSRATADPLLMQYAELRERAAGDPRRQLHLARWCQRMKLAERGKLHYAYLAYDPAVSEDIRAEAIKKLDLQIVGGQLVSQEQLETYQDNRQQYQAALEKWQTPLSKWGEALVSDNPRRQALARKQMAAIDDPQIVPVCELFIGVSGPVFGEELIGQLSKFKHYESTAALTRFAVLSPWEKVRTAAVVQLKQRPWHDFVPHLLDGLIGPIQSQWNIRLGPGGDVNYRHAFFREGIGQNHMLAHEHNVRVRGIVVGEETLAAEPTTPEERQRALVRRFNGFRPGSAERDQTAAAWEAMSTYAQAYLREQQVARTNASIEQSNAVVFGVLAEVTNQKLPSDPSRWWLWWQKYNEDVKPRPTRYLYSQTNSSINVDMIAQYQYEYHSCFAPSTTVWTETGPRPIEQIEVGDQVYSQDPETGELALKLVQDTTAGPPTARMTHLQVGGDTVRATLGHVIWVNGKGWRIAKRVEVGDRLHGMEGSLVVKASEECPALPIVYNLVVEDCHSYFVGKSPFLVHDITRREPTQAVLPGLVGAD